MRRIALFGSTGSIGTQALEVIDCHPDLLSVYALTTHSRVELLIQQALRYKPQCIVIADPDAAAPYRNELEQLPCTVLSGREGLLQLAADTKYDLMLSALVGFAGLAPTLTAIQHHHDIALANKETLVVGGEIIMQAARDAHVQIYPVDSEHSAIYQCILGEEAPPERIYLTASGGPFWQTPLEQLEHVTLQQALKHPRWTMGSKVTIDSATMMNKGFELIEACHLFHLTPQQISVLIHPESVVHSMVLFADGAVKAQLGSPDMRIPISLALHAGRRQPIPTPRYDFVGESLHFSSPDPVRFPALQLAIEAFEQGGNAPCILNAANEVAVDAFLRGRIRYIDIVRIAEQMLRNAPYSPQISLASLQKCHQEVTQNTLALINDTFA